MVSNPVIDLELRIKQNLKLKAIHDRVEIIPPIDPGHGFDHTLRVAKLCGRLYLEESRARGLAKPSELEVDSAIVAGLLHDCVPIAKNSELRSQSANLSAREAEKWLVGGDWGPLDLIHRISDSIQDHSYSSGRAPRSLMGEVLQDADRLEALGAIGLYRTIATGVTMGCKLFDPEDPWAECRALDDKKFTIDHFYNKLFKLPATFRTGAARAEAQRRADYLHKFIDQLKSELH
ncbi:MAG: HD domain-containing protein [Bdellovibrionales bacterium]|nr:HD domain-containing protein [Bdellovibrionales bacterium]